MAEKGSRHRFELSRLELAGVAVSTAAGFFVVFLLGIYAGRGMVERGAGEGDELVRLPVPAATDETAPPRDEITFYEELGGGDRAERLAGGEPEVPARPAAPANAAPPVPVVPEPPPVAPVAAPQPPPAAVARIDAPPPTPVASPAARVAVAIAKPEPPPAGSGGEWSVQVSATRDPRTAQSIMRKLKERGYVAYVRETKRQGATFYRVRVGHYASLEEANKVVSRLRKEPGVPEAFVASD